MNRIFITLILLLSATKILAQMPDMKDYENIAEETIEGKKGYGHCPGSYLKMEWIENEQGHCLEAYDKTTKCYFRVYRPSVLYPNIQTSCEIEDGEGNIYKTKTFKKKQTSNCSNQYECTANKAKKLLKNKNK